MDISSSPEQETQPAEVVRFHNAFTNFGITPMMFHWNIIGWQYATCDTCGGDNVWCTERENRME